MFGRSLFFRFYPSNMRQAEYPEAKNLRWLLGLYTYLHIVFFLVSLTAIGFRSMLTELLYGSLAYSCYLTLSHCSIIVYMIALLLNTTLGILNIIGKHKSTYALFFYIINLIFYGFALYFLYFKYNAFRKSGGVSNSKEEKLLKNKDKSKGPADNEKGKSPSKK